MYNNTASRSLQNRRNQPRRRIWPKYPAASSVWENRDFWRFWRFLVILEHFWVKRVKNEKIMLLNFYFHVVNHILFGNTAPRSRRKWQNQALLVHFWGHPPLVHGSPIESQTAKSGVHWWTLGVHEKIFKKIFSTSDSCRTRRVRSKSYTFYPQRWRMAPPLTPGMDPPPKHDHMDMFL